ncbi:sensor histidine kinase [uncultured Sneathiella sp.]|mgnify:FL=1|jgi:Na+/proline symporter/nitrogen-specific signal transduction histidine kinase|uniref:sensor histidine kinase n=1 Tax=uncultured Sneathiella sp. TaxID=879315 RepID=UPI0030D87C84|tara:strand:- start:60740 stop:63490 length:2751 start_codon:yes stop_codon:yes gene_type:complete
MSGGIVLTVSFLYLGLLFAIAQFVDSRAEKGRPLTRNPYIYTLSIAVFCTSWTFYGSVGLAATRGLDFLPIYLGPTLVFVLWSIVWVKIVRICKVHRITSIADFIASRYGKQAKLGGLVTIIAVVGTTPYISLQLKSIATSFRILVSSSETALLHAPSEPIFFIDTTLIVAIALALFAILFGTRHIDASEHHEGLVAAIAFESVVKLVSFLAVGFFVTYGLFNGFSDLFTTAAESGLSELFTVSSDNDYSVWMTMTILSMAAIICLPRQFYITAVENPDESFLRKATWLFPLYLLVINIFVLPIALAGRLSFGGASADADMFMLTVPLFHDQAFLALIAFVGGLSAATSMVIVAAIALSTMVCNDLIMPLLLRWKGLNINKNDDLTGLLLTIRRVSILLILILGYVYYLIASESYSLVTIGLVSFAAAAQFAPAIIGGIFWKGASYRGALMGLALGFLAWLYTLLLPSFAQSGWLPLSFITEGPYGIDLLKPYALFGMDGFDRLTHALFWSMLLNIGAYWVVSLLSQQTAIERIQGTLFVDVFGHTDDERDSRYWRGSATVADLQQLVGRFVGVQRAAQAFSDFAADRDINLRKSQTADAALLDFAEKMLAGAIGSATARVMVGSVVKGEIVGLEEVYRILDETSQVIEYSHRLEQKSAELERATAQLRNANERLQELDSLKDHFLSMVSHELRTPLTSLRAFGEILVDNPEVSPEERTQFLNVIIKESSRLTRLIDQLLDLARMEAGQMDWSLNTVDMEATLHEAMAALAGLIKENDVIVDVNIPDHLPKVRADRDQLIQVIINLVSNAIKFCDKSNGRIDVAVSVADNMLEVSVSDNGKGIPENMSMRIFEKFHQSLDRDEDKPQGSGLGLAICREIVTFHGGQVWVVNKPEGGAVFSFTVPRADRLEARLSAE